ncbi:MAG: hypothetical protein IKB45_04095 [Clostridia bacterium]|nr:hypothetical protein [Clostridia bacterium]
MKNLKRVLAMLLVAVLLFSFAGCHKKDEIAVTVGDVKFTSAYYMCALMSADGEAKTKVDEKLAEKEDSDSTSTEEVDYYSQKIDGKKYEEWVEERAIEMLKEIAAYKILCKENKLEIDKETASSAEMYASYYWSSYGYGAYYEPNGVGQATYTNFMKDSYYSELYFEHLYGKEGEKALAEDKVKSTIYDNFIIANVLEGAITSEMKDADKTALKTKFDGYLADLKAGKKTFEEIYKTHNNIKDEEEKKEETTEDKTDEEKPAEPKDKYATILGAKETTYESEHYDTVKAMATGEIKLIEKEDKSGYVLVVKQDIKADEYYLENLDSTARHMLADEEYEKTIADYVKGLKAEINKYATGQFKVKKIVEPTYN